MRRKEREVTDYNKMIEILKSCDCCRIGLVDDKGAYIVPMNSDMKIITANLHCIFTERQRGRRLI